MGCMKDGVPWIPHAPCNQPASFVVCSLLSPAVPEQPGSRHEDYHQGGAVASLAGALQEARTTLICETKRITLCHQLLTRPGFSDQDLAGRPVGSRFDRPVLDPDRSMNAIRDGSVLKISIEYRVVQFFIPISHLTQTHPVDAIAPEQITRNNNPWAQGVWTYKCVAASSAISCLHFHLHRFAAVSRIGGAARVASALLQCLIKQQDGGC